jgi:hypothetical protein
MLQRVTSSPHFDTALGFFAAAIGVYVAICLLVGVSVTIVLIGKAVTSWF